MGIFSRIGKKANAALDKAIDPAREVDMAILELEEQRKKALAELVSYKATAKQMQQDIERYRTKAAEWEQRAMKAVRAGDDEAARQALREQKNCLVEATKIKRDHDEAAGYAIELNKSRKVFEVKLQQLKLRKGTLALQIAAGRAGGDAFGNDGSVWDKFQAAEDRIDEETVASEVDAAMRGEAAADAELEAKVLAAGERAGVPQLAAGADADAQLSELKARVAADRAARQRALGAGGPPPAAPAKGPAAGSDPSES
ncbi:MAG: PspA/IM30 family protein [Kofleriaceae bacterium]